MLKTKHIIDEKNKLLRTVSKEVVFPLTDEDRKTINDIIEYLTNSQIEELALKYDLRPGMGMAAIQLGIPKRYFVVVHEYEEKKFNTYVIINPKIVSTSTEKIYVTDGEGCLSVNEEKDGYVPRHAKVTVKGYDVLTHQDVTIVARGFLSICLQHELDHFDGVLFYDHFNKNNPKAPLPNAMIVE